MRLEFPNHIMFTESHITKNLRQILEMNCEPSDELVTDLESSATLRRFTKGKTIIKQGEMCSHFVFIRKGLMVVTNVTDGIEDTLLFGTSGDVFTSLHSYQGGEPAIFSLIALEDSEVWLVEFAQMKRLFTEHYDMLLWMHNLMVDQLYTFEKRYTIFNNKSAEERFVNFLLDRYGSIKRAPIGHIHRIVPLKYIAQYLNITQSTLSRLRKKLVAGEGNY